MENSVTELGAASQLSPSVTDLLARFRRGEATPVAMAEAIGMRLVEVESGRAVFDLEVDLARHANPMGTLHGGVLCSLADSAMGMAYAATLDADATFATLELKINFLRPMWRGRLTATGRVGPGRPERRSDRMRRGRRRGPSGRPRQQHLHDPARRAGLRSVAFPARSSAPPPARHRELSVTTKRHVERHVKAAKRHAGVMPTSQFATGAKLARDWTPPVWRAV